MTEQQNFERLLRRMAEMSDGDLSVLDGAIKTPESATVVTAAGSWNDILWSEFAVLGWMTRQPDLPANGLVSNKVFSIAAAGVQPIRNLLSVTPQRKRELYEKRADIYKSLCVPFVTKLREEVLKVDSSYGTILPLAGMTLGIILKTFIAPADHDKAAARILDLAKKLARQP